jgi:hypothetical protein
LRRWLSGAVRWARWSGLPARRCRKGRPCLHQGRRRRG